MFKFIKDLFFPTVTSEHYVDDAVNIISKWKWHHTRKLPKNWEVLGTRRINGIFIELIKTNKSVYVYSEWDEVKLNGTKQYELLYTGACSFILGKWVKELNLEHLEGERYSPPIIKG